jgi:fructuronate reductase
MSLSPDPLLPELGQYVREIQLGKELPEGVLVPILSSERLFGSDLYELGIASKVECYVSKMIEGPGAVRRTLDEIMAKER